MHRVRMLLHFGATPVMVFDGAALPMKAGTHTERRERRETALGKAEQALAEGNRRLAEEWYQKACPVTPEMARRVIRQLRKINVEYIVAPYEADAQLAWMMQTGFVDSVITEDSDLLVYGASRVFYKMTKTGEGDLYETKNLPALDTISMRNFTEDMFVYMCVCSGCDFFKGVSGLGIRKSHNLVRKYRTMSRLCQVIRHDGRYSVTKTFTVDFARACLVFRHQSVYDVKTSEMVHLRALDDVAKKKLPPMVVTELFEGDVVDLSFLGAHHDPAIAKKVAEGMIHPSSLKEYDEPLDMVERPVDRPRRPSSFPEPQEIRPSTQKHGPRSVPGFQVYPAGSGLKRAFGTAPNLRQRLSGRSRSFNPRRVAANFRARNTVANTSTPKFASTGVWAKFQNTTKEKHELDPSSKECTKESDSSYTSDEEKENTDETLPVHRPMKRPRSSNMDSGDEKRLTLCPPAPHRVAAVNRILGRFAANPNQNKKLKFQESEPKDTSPPSPDRKAYELFDEIDADLSRDAEEPKAPVLPTSSTPVKEPQKPLKANQVRLSRFFANNDSTRVGSQVVSQKLVAKPMVSPPKTPTTLQNAKSPRQNSINSLHRFKRGASGKTFRTDTPKS